MIVQAPLSAAPWLGYADLLLRVASPSRLGAWSYEVQDTKLAHTTSVGAVMQLCLYTDMVAGLQGKVPERMSVVSPGAPFSVHALRPADFLAFYRSASRLLLEFTRAGKSTEADPVAHCDICGWRRRCEAGWRHSDHLSLVAGISRSQRAELVKRRVSTLAALAGLPLPRPFKLKPSRLPGLTRVREQARVQLAGRRAEEPVREILKPIVPGRGLARLPPPSAGDLFFDLEGDPFVAGGGLEYLWGLGRSEGGRFVYEGSWAYLRGEEGRAFEGFMDRLVGHLAQHPDAHVYHYAAYEPAALRRLSGRFNSRAEVLGRMFEARVFVDLYAVVRESVRAAVESCSIKKLEPFYGFARDVALPDVGPAKAALEAALELTAPGVMPATEATWRAIVETYNSDDCRSTWQLRDWLESLRAEVVAAGEAIARPEPPQPRRPAPREEEDEATGRRRDRLLSGQPAVEAERTADQRARALLAALLDYHRREARAASGEKFAFLSQSSEELVDHRHALGGLTFVRRGPPSAGGGLPVDHYRFPPQHADIEAGKPLTGHGGVSAGKRLGQVLDIDLERGELQVKRTKATLDLQPENVFVEEHFPFPAGARALGEPADRLIESPAPRVASDVQAAWDLLCRAPPRLRRQSLGVAHRPPESPVEWACRLSAGLEAGVLPIQGPPGAGKSTTGAHIILALARRGLKVGVTAVAHRVIADLVAAAAALAAEEGLAVAFGHRHDLDADEHPGAPESAPAVRRLDDSAEALAELQANSLQVLGGVAWLWASAAAKQAVDVLIVDEAGQLSLANTLAVSRAARSLVLLGDPQQLVQPQRGSHPPGADASALEHLLQGSSTLSPEAGIFLPQTHRLSPPLCRFTSESFYDNRLAPTSRAAAQTVQTGPLAGGGLWCLDVPHAGNTHASEEEAQAILTLVQRVGSAEGEWAPDSHRVLPLGLSDLLVVTPYNAQASLLRRLLPREVKVGTVDKLQGAERAVVIVSMAASTPEEAPRGMGFLLSPNRLNVATSRGRVACVLVASPFLYTSRCQTVEHLRLANLMCRYRELARLLSSAVASRL